MWYVGDNYTSEENLKTETDIYEYLYVGSNINSQKYLNYKWCSQICLLCSTMWIFLARSRYILYVNVRNLQSIGHCFSSSFYIWNYIWNTSGITIDCFLMMTLAVIVVSQIPAQNANFDTAYSERSSFSL